MAVADFLIFLDALRTRSDVSRVNSDSDPSVQISRRRFLKLTALTGSTLATGQLLGLLAPRSAQAQSASSTVRFAIIGDFGETLRDQEFPVDRLGAMIRSWNPDFVVSVGDDNYILGEASTIDTNIGKNFTSFIYPKGTNYPEYYPYPPNAPLHNRFFSALGNHDYGDVGDDFPPTTEKIALSQPYIDYLANSLQGPQAPYTTVTFAPNADGQSYDTNKDGYVCGSYAPFTEATNIRFYDVRLGTTTGPSSVHLFIFDSNKPTPYGRYWRDQTISNSDNTCTATVKATQGAWLQQRLAASTARWKIVIFHHPPYYSATGAKDAQYETMRWPFQQWGASAVITGHVHNYERLSMPDADWTNQPNYSLPRIPYMVNGAGGFVPEQGFDPNFVIPGSISRVENYGAQLVSANDDSISFLYYDIDGVLRDSLTLWNDANDAPKDVQFGAEEFVFPTNGQSAILTVVRQGNLSQPLTVHFTTMDGTAKQGVDYVATAGTITFGAWQNTASISIPLIQPVYPPNTQTPTSLAFTVLLSAPDDHTSLGFFKSTTVLLQNDVQTPLNDLDSFITQSYLDILNRPATSVEILAAREWIGFGSSNPVEQDLAFLSYFRRAEWIAYLLTSGFTSNPSTSLPVLNVALIFSLINLSELFNIFDPGEAVPPTYQDLNFWTTQWINQENFLTTDQLVTQTSDGFNQNIVEFLLNYIKSSFTAQDLGGDPVLEDAAFIVGIYLVFVLPIGHRPTAEDIAYWLPIVGQPGGRYTLLGRISVESFDPPPASGMTAFNLAGTPTDLTQGNQLLALTAIVVAGLTRTQPTFNEFYYQRWQPIRYSNNVPVTFTDLIYNTLISPGYAARFAVISSPIPTPRPASPPSPVAPAPIPFQAPAPTLAEQELAYLQLRISEIQKNVKNPATRNRQIRRIRDRIRRIQERMRAATAFTTNE